MAGFVGVDPSGLTLRELWNLATGKRAQLVQQAGLVWVDGKFDAEWFVETGEWAVPDPKATEAIKAKASAIADEMMNVPPKERSQWLIERTSKLAKPT